MVFMGSEQSVSQRIEGLWLVSACVRPKDSLQSKGGLPNHLLDLRS